MTVRDFLFISGDPALDFVNTEIVRDGEPVDLLESREALADWLTAAGILPRERARAAATPAALAGVLELRTSLREVASHMASGKPPRRADVAVIDGHLHRGHGSLTLQQREGRMVSAFEPDPAVADDPRYLLARAAATFLAMADPGRIHACQGAKCILFFYDVTKSGTRRWCSMSGCGNRAKAAEHYRKQKLR